MGPLGIAIMIGTAVAVVGWYTALVLGYVHSVYVLAPA